MPFKAFLTHSILSIVPIHAAKIEIITIDGVIIPSVAIIQPANTACLYPMKVATFTAIIPGVDWLTA